MLHGTVHGFDVYFTIYVTNQAFGRAPSAPEIFGFRGVVVKSGWPRNDPSGVRFNNEPKEGYRDQAMATVVAGQVGSQLAQDLAYGKP